MTRTDSAFLMTQCYMKRAEAVGYRERAEAAGESDDDAGYLHLAKVCQEDAERLETIAAKLRTTGRTP